MLNNFLFYHLPYTKCKEGDFLFYHCNVYFVDILKSAEKIKNSFLYSQLVLQRLSELSKGHNIGIFKLA